MNNKRIYYLEIGFWDCLYLATILSNFHLLTYSIAYNIMKKNIQSMKKSLEKIES